MYLQFGLLECIEEHHTLVEIFSNDPKTNRIAPLMNPPPATSTTMHSRLTCQDRNLCLGDTAIFQGPGKPPKLLTHNVILKSFKIYKVLSLCDIVCFIAALFLAVLALWCQHQWGRGWLSGIVNKPKQSVPNSGTSTSHLFWPPILVVGGRHAKRQLFYTNMVWAKNILPKKCVNYNKSNLRQNSVKGQKDHICVKNAKKVTKSRKMCQKMPPKSAKLRHYSISRQNSVKSCKHITQDRIFFTPVLLARWYVLHLWVEGLLSTRPTRLAFTS